jgi:hypothetical protein
MGDEFQLRRERDLGAIIGDSFSLLFTHFRAFAAIIFPAAITALAISLLILAIENETLNTLVLVASVIVQFIVFEIVRSAGVIYLDSLDRREEFPSAEALDRAQQRIGIIAGAAFRSAVIVMLFSITVVGIPFAIMRLVRWAFLSQVIMLEQEHGQAVLAKSAELVKGYWWSTAGRLLVAGIVVGLPAFFVSSVAAATTHGVVSAFVDAALVFITIPYGIISTTLMYFHLKARKARHDSITSPD